MTSRGIGLFSCLQRLKKHFARRSKTREKEDGVSTSPAHEDDVTEFSEQIEPKSQQSPHPAQYSPSGNNQQSAPNTNRHFPAPIPTSQASSRHNTTKQHHPVAPPGDHESEQATPSQRSPHGSGDDKGQQIPIPSIVVHPADANDEPHYGDKSDDGTWSTSPLETAQQTVVRNTSHKSSSSKRPSLTSNKAENLQEKLQQCRGLIEKVYSNPDPEKRNVRDPCTYVSLRKLRKVLNETILNDMLKFTSWYKVSWREQLYSEFLLIIAILIVSGWKEWEAFANLFYNQQGYNQQRDRIFTRCDRHLPFDYDKLDFLGDPAAQYLFWLTQYIFKHHVFQEDDECDMLAEHTRVPFTEVELIRKGERRIYRATIDKYGLSEKIKAESRYINNKEPKVVALKTFTNKGPFDAEREANRTLQHLRRTHDHIVVMIKAYVVGARSDWPAYTLMYPWAQTDLEKLCFGVTPLCDVITSERFNPSRTMTQIEGLADALQFLHDSMVNMWHLDLKLENIFIYALDSADSQSIGVWKIADFGLAKERLKILNAATSVREPSSTSAPRDIGTYQAPEMIWRTGRVNDRTDCWSFICVLKVVLAFILGGPLAVKQYRAVRLEGNDNDQFFKRIRQEGTNHDRFVLKQNAWNWLVELVRVKTPADAEWTRIIMDCMKDALIVERDDRPSADYLFQHLRIANRALGKVDKQILEEWQYSPVTTEDFQPTIESEATISAIDASGQPPPPAELISQMLTHASTWFTECSAWQGLRLSFQPLMARMSGGWLAFMGENQIAIFDLENIINSELLIGSSSRSGSAMPMIETSLKIQALDNEIFKAIRLEGDYLALVREAEVPGSDGDVAGRIRGRDVKIYQLNHSQHFEPASGWTAERPVPADCFDVIISAQGTLARLFNHGVRVSTKADLDGFDETLIEVSNVRTAAFSVVGDYFCVWNRGNSGRQWWRMWHVSNLSTNRYTHKYSAEEHSGPLSRSGFGDTRLSTPCLLATRDGCHFFAFDQDEKVWFLSLQENEKVQSEVFDLRDDAVVLSISETTCIILRRENGLMSASASMGVPTHGKTAQPLLQLRSMPTIHWDPASNSPLADATTIPIADNDGFALLYIDGVVEIKYRSLD